MGEQTVWLVMYKGNVLVDTTRRFVRVLKVMYTSANIFTVFSKVVYFGRFGGRVKFCMSSWSGFS